MFIKMTASSHYGGSSLSKIKIKKFNMAAKMAGQMVDNHYQKLKLKISIRRPRWRVKTLIGYN